jgi:spore coat protein U-like protein
MDNNNKKIMIWGDLKMKKITLSSLAASLILATTMLSNPVQAGTTTGATKATATWSSYCNISATDVNFGAYTPGSANRTGKNGVIPGNTTVTVMCTHKTAYNVYGETYLSDETWHMKGATAGNTDVLQYAAWLTSDYYSGWFGQGYSGTNHISGTGTGGNQNYTIYFGIYTQAYVTPDSYSDTYTLTLSY